MEDPVEARDHDSIAVYWDQGTHDLVIIFSKMFCILVVGPKKLCELEQKSETLERLGVEILSETWSKAVGIREGFT